MTGVLGSTMRPMYLDGAAGRLFAICFEPPANVETRGAFLFSPAFGEEMNKSRRMIAMQARSFAAAGWSVLVADPYGTGDSDGDLRDASVSLWIDDLSQCHKILSEKTGGAVGLWGHRFGVLLCAAAIQKSRLRLDRLLFWQPLLRGNTILKALFRQRMVASIGEEGKSKRDSRHLRKQLANGETLEISGYEISPDLADGLEAMRLDMLVDPQVSVNWLELSRSEAPPPVDPGAAIRDRWTESGREVTYRRVVGEPFWAAGEIIEIPALIHTTGELMC